MKKKRRQLIPVDEEEVKTKKPYLDPITGLPRRGRPPVYTDPKELEKRGMEYFRSCWAKVTDKKGNTYWKHTRPYTISGLAVALGMSRVTLLDYETGFRNYTFMKSEEDKEILRERNIKVEVKKKGVTKFSSTIKKLKAICQQFGEERLYQGHAAGPIFNLCNNYERWYQKTIQEVGGKDGGDIPLSITISSEVDEDI